MHSIVGRRGGDYRIDQHRQRPSLEQTETGRKARKYHEQPDRAAVVAEIAERPEDLSDQRALVVVDAVDGSIVETPYVERIRPV